ncbi:AAA family ATPase [Luteimonas vadosa]|uniref:AAA family ATPase n=1 Tax=Luteimonas vadosa TaxID=1165507 RepID=A0ABP9E900_9GAMM
MYLEHYGLNEPPFSITPDPRFVYLSERHRDALAHLLFGITQGGGGGFVQLTGEVGTGKTTLSRLLLEQIPDNARVALVLNPRLSATELLETICEELHLDLDGARGSAKALVDRLNAYLLDAYAQGLRVVLVVDEAQNLPVDALEQVRLLTNLETDTQKLLQIILLGQPELRDMLARPELRQLAQRITARFHLTPLDAGETAEYMRHRYRIAGGQRLPFSARALQRIHRRSGGVPRLTNVIAERALLAGYARDAATIDEALVEAAASEALPPMPHRHKRGWWMLVGAGALVALVVVGVALWMRPSPHEVAGPELAMAKDAPGPLAAQPVASSPTETPGPAGDGIPAIDGDMLASAIAAATDSPLPAWSRLLEQWQLPNSSSDAQAATRCTPALAPGVFCLRGRARLDRLAAIGRPVLLRLHAGSRDAWAVLLGVDALHARLWLDGKTVETDRIALQDHWRGEYVAPWRGEPLLAEPMIEPLAPGSRGPAVDWVRARLSPGFLDPSLAEGEYDATLANAVRRFQRAHALGADGVVGPETLFALASRQPGPRLVTRLD